MITAISSYVKYLHNLELSGFTEVTTLTVCQIIVQQKKQLSDHLDLSGADHQLDIISKKELVPDQEYLKMSCTIYILILLEI